MKMGEKVVSYQQGGGLKCVRGRYDLLRFLPARARRY